MQQYSSDGDGDICCCSLSSCRGLFLVVVVDVDDDDDDDAVVAGFVVAGVVVLSVLSLAVFVAGAAGDNIEKEGAADVHVEDACCIVRFVSFTKQVSRWIFILLASK